MTKKKLTLDELAQFDELGRMADSMDNVLTATRLTVSEAYHLAQCKMAIEQWSKQLKELALTYLTHL